MNKNKCCKIDKIDQYSNKIKLTIVNLQTYEESLGMERKLEFI